MLDEIIENNNEYKKYPKLKQFKIKLNKAFQYILCFHNLKVPKLMQWPNINSETIVFFWKLGCYVYNVYVMCKLIYIIMLYVQTYMYILQLIFLNNLIDNWLKYNIYKHVTIYINM